MEKQQSEPKKQRFESPARWIGIFAGILAAFLAGYLFRPAPQTPDTHEEYAAAPAKQTWWTCSMHPEIRLPNPGLCPKCHMELIPMEDGSRDDEAPRTLAVSEHARRLMDIETAPVQRLYPEAVVRMVGKVDYDETKMASISAWVPGRLDRLFVDYTGVTVQKGDHMVSLYSPELYSAQEELLQARKAATGMEQSNSSLIRDITQSTVEAARDKLRLWGLTPEQIAQIEQSGKADDHVTIYAPIGGVVIQKDALEGQYVQTGTKIYTIADLSQVWVYLDAYESDLERLRYGQPVEFTTVSYPGEVFRGTISFIDPVLNDRTRTVRVRVNVPNSEGKLKPKMFVRATVKARIAEGGRIMDKHLAGKWICPMHPEIVRDEPGTCNICGMPLVRAETLGYVDEDASDARKPLVIPASAPLITGTRAVVYVEVPDREKPTFEGREIVLGPRAGDWYIVRSGLREGERVVVKGNFKIDSSLQIQAKPSMMSPEGGGGGGHDHGGEAARKNEPRAATNASSAFRTQLGHVVRSYYEIQRSLAGDDPAKAAEAFKSTLKTLEAADARPLSEGDREVWRKTVGPIKTALTDGASADDINKARESFHLLSQALTDAIKRYGVTGTGTVYVLHCPMAFNDTGADWLQDSEDVFNPYFGATMLKCGGVKDTIVPATSSEPEGK